jgi:hypothetical protein
MKTILITALALSTLALSAATSLAQPKGGEVLVALTKGAAKPEAVVAMHKSDKAMLCSLCRNEFVKVAQPAEKMGRREMATVVQHGCSACENKIQATGHGKAKTESVVHTCAHSGDPTLACCN